MASQLNIPSISSDDLLAYHTRTFGKIFPGSIPDLSAGSTPSNILDEVGVQSDDTLGYYQDGEKRTLTDAQIAMFRHSEIQALLREQRHDREKESSDFLTVARSKELQDGAWGVQELEEDNVVEGVNIKDKVVEDIEVEEDGEVEEDEEEEYARFLEAERREMELIASSQSAKNSKSRKSKAGKFSTRRVVRELDEIPSGTNALDYGD